MAQAFFNNYSKDHSSISAGTQVGEHEGEKIGENPKALYVWEVMDEEGIDVRDYRRSQLNENMLRDADKVVVITNPESWPDYLKNSSKLEYWDIDDAKGTDYNFHVKSRDEVKIRVQKLLESI